MAVDGLVVVNVFEGWREGYCFEKVWGII